MEPEKNALPSEEDSQKIKKENEGIDWQRKEGVTIEEVKATSGYTHLTDEQAEEMVHFIEIYCMLIYNLHKKQVEDRQQDNESDEPKNKAA